MTELGLGGLLIVALVLLVLLGVHIAVALLAVGFFGVWLVRENIDMAMRLMYMAAYNGVADFIFATIPLFVLMGLLVSISNVGKDTFMVAEVLLRRLRGGLGVATVAANTVFAAVTGVSIASAAVFTRVAVPEMVRHGYKTIFATGTVAGSSVLGMMIPPSLLMIIYGVLAEQSIGKLFIAGIIPGFIVVTLFIGYIMWVAIRHPERVGEGAVLPAAQQLARDANDLVEEKDMKAILLSTLGILCLIVLVLGGIWLGLFTPTEGAGVGATLALILALMRGMKMSEMLEAILSVGKTSAPLLLLLVAAQLYSRVLAMTGVTGATKDFFMNSGLSPYVILALMVLVWFILGCIIDSISIILLTVPVFAPLAVALGFDPIAFAIIGIIAIETGLLTPPFGILVFTVKAAVTDEKDLTPGEIFKGAIPYWIMLLIAILSIVFFPQVATWLPNLGNAVKL